MTDPLKPTVPGTIQVEGEQVYVVASPTGRKAKRYPVRPEHLDPAGTPTALLDGQPAQLTWDIAEGRIVSVAVRVPDTGPVSLTDTDGFLNPYGFVSIPDRGRLPDELQDREPAGHDRYRDDRWTGTIAVKLTTRTPLLLPDHARAALDTSQPAPLPVRVDHLGRPLLAGSAVKGALRSAYEAITNSRFGVFDDPDQRLAIRATADRSVAERLWPAYVSEVGDGGATLIATSLRPTGLPESLEQRPVQPAVWVPRRLACATGCRAKDRCRKPEGRHCADRRGRRVAAWLYLAQVKGSLFWRVLEYADPESSAEPTRQPAPTKNTSPVADYPRVKVIGRLHWTGSTFPAGGDGKHDERMVVESVLSGPAELECHEVAATGAHLAGWRAVIDSYDGAHEYDRHRKRNYGGYVVDPNRWRRLEVDDTLYVELDQDHRPIDLYPAMIGRKPFPGTPRISLPKEHRPAADRGRLSPADRVFGWVRQGADHSRVAHRGHLRVLPPDDAGTPGPETVRNFPQPVPLTTLNSPKPSQFRFYLGDADGSPLNGSAREPQQGYPAEPGHRRLRGRKVYLTHAELLDDQVGANDYWDPLSPPVDLQPIPVGGRQRYREYLRHPDAKAPASESSEVATWISGWVSPGTIFRLTLHVDNLDGTELGALLWLLDLPGGGSLKLGLGKPLGFGAVRMCVDWDATRLYTGEQLRERYQTLSRHPEPTEPREAKALADAYDENVLQAHLRQVRTEFLNAARGFTDAAVHYPRLGTDDEPPGTPARPRTTTYDWWVANDKVGKGGRFALGGLANPESMPLPYQPTAESGKGQQSGEQRGRAPGPGTPGAPKAGRGKRRVGRGQAGGSPGAGRPRNGSP